MSKKNAATFLVCINEKDHSRIALRFAMAKARTTGAEVLILYIMDPMEYNSPFAVGDVLKEARMQEAETLLGGYIEEAQNWGGSLPRTLIREGGIREGILATIDEDNSISLLVMGVSADGSSNKGKLLTQLTAEMGVNLHIPLMIIPGNLTDEEINGLNGMVK